MKNRKKLVSIVAGILAAVMLLGIIAGVLPSYVSAEDNRSSSQIKAELEDLKDQQTQIEEQIDGLNDQLVENLGQMEKVVVQKNAIDQEIFLLYQKIDNINEQIATYNELIANKQEELDQAQKHLQELNEKNKERIRAMEEDGQLSYWSVLFKANSFSDLLDRLNMIEEIAASDQRRLEEMNRAAQAVERAKEALETEKAAVEATKQELGLVQEELELKRAEADALLQQLVAKGIEYEDLLDQAEAENAAMMEEINRLNSAYDEAKEREYQQWLASQPPVIKDNMSDTPIMGGQNNSSSTVDGATWLVPINYTRFTSPFGWREHPVYGGQRFHYGVDLSAPQGTPIYASRGGQVTTATYGSSGGYYVIINHLDGYTSNYLHMTHYIVSPGEYVAAGQVIGYCGSTGASTGPHLHFAIYKNGTAVNPAEYIPI